MKRLLIALVAFALTLGVACKKESVVEPEKKQETFSVKKVAFSDDVHDPNSLGCKCTGCQPVQNPPRLW